MRAVPSYLVGYGSEEVRACSIPHGYPWSMAALSLLMYPYIRLMNSTDPESQIRVLAGDLLISTGLGEPLAEDEVVELHGEAANTAVTFMVDVGAALSAR
eukprot:118554-Alexandrium_andersonii.AAC.1